MEVLCSIGKDGAKRYFRGGKRVKAPSDDSSQEVSCVKTGVKTGVKKGVKKTTKAPKKATKTTRPAPKKAKAKKPKAPAFHIWELKTGYTTLDSTGGIESYWSIMPEGKRLGKTFKLPVRHVGHATKYELETSDFEIFRKNPENYAVYKNEDHLKIIQYPRSSDRLIGFEKILPLKNQLKYIWSFRQMKRQGGESFTFIKPVMAFFKLRKEVKELAKKLNPTGELYYTDAETSEAMEEIVEMRQNWSSEQWEIFESNIYTQIAIFSKLKKI